MSRGAVVRKVSLAFITCDPDFEAVAVEELRRAIGSASTRTIDAGDAIEGRILLLGLEEEFDDFSDGLARSGSMFIRHLSPAQLEVPLTGMEADVDRMREALPEIAWLLDPESSFSVQSRILGIGQLPYRKAALNEALSNELETMSCAPMDCRDPQQVVSVLCTPETAYLGVSATFRNRSSWPGGKHRFKRDEQQISRAEFKLLEALSVFRIDLPKSGLALDMGAAPGGWSRVLAERGLTVDAVDPAELDERLRANLRVKHYPRRIQEYAVGVKRFQAIVNDMKMDARDSADLMLRFADRLEPDGVGIMTLKLPRPSVHGPKEALRLLDMIQIDLRLLGTGFEVIGVRQLYHNRSEVTVAMRAR